MPTIQGKLHENERALIESLVVNLTTDQNAAVAGSFQLPVRCSINMHAPHMLELADGRCVPITITRLSHFSGDVEFREAARPAMSP